MPELIGHICLESASGRLPWHGLSASGPAVVADPALALKTLDELGRLTQSQRYVGYLSYELGRSFERLPVPPASGDVDMHLPAFAFIPVGSAPPQDATAENATPSSQLLHPTVDQTGYERAVRRCLDYISAGDVFQINLSQRLAVRTTLSPRQVFEQLRRFPAEYGALLDFGRFALVSNSPELFLRVTTLSDGRRRIVNRPIKGTRPNAPGMKNELLHSAKDQAELAMIVDLQRNDLGRICEIGSVVVTEPRTIETHPTVLHGVATVEGILRQGVSLTDILRATFPCGSITGCPKIRAMQIIDELEGVRRHAYCGAIGWIGGGELELSVAIRTMTMFDGVAYVPVGGGIVADSDPAAEYEETLTKAAAMLAALGVTPHTADS